MTFSEKDNLYSSATLNSGIPTTLWSKLQVFLKASTNDKTVNIQLFKLDLRIIMVGFREHVTQNVSDLTDVLGESVAGYLFFISIFIFPPTHQPSPLPRRTSSFHSLH